MANMDERISKVKFKEGEWIIHTVQPLDEGDKDSVIKLRAQPHPDLVAAFQALEYTVREIWEFPKSWAKDKISIVGVSFSYSESTGVEGATVTALVTLDDTSASPGVLNTPHLPFDQYAEGGNQPVMSQESIDLLQKFRNEAMNYVSGKKRAQSGFDFGAAA